MSDHIYYLVGSDSPIMKVIDECRAKHKVYADSLVAFKDSQGATSVITMNNERVIGLVFEGEAPAGWKLKAGVTWYVPDGRTKIGKALRDKMNAIPRSPNGLDFSGMLSYAADPKDPFCKPELGDFTHFADHHMYWSNYGHYGDKVILSVPALCTVKTPGCTELKMSEFYKIAEDWKASQPKTDED